MSPAPHPDRWTLDQGRSSHLPHRLGGAVPRIATAEPQARACRVRSGYPPTPSRRDCAKGSSSRGLSSRSRVRSWLAGPAGTRSRGPSSSPRPSSGRGPADPYGPCRQGRAADHRRHGGQGQRGRQLRQPGRGGSRPGQRGVAADLRLVLRHPVDRGRRRGRRDPGASAARGRDHVREHAGSARSRRPCGRRAAKLVAFERIPAADVIAALEASEDTEIES